MLSAKKVAMDKSVQGEVQSETKTGQSVMKKSATVTTIVESNKILGCCPIKMEKDDSKDKEKKERAEILTDTKVEHSKPKSVQVKNSEAKMEKVSNKISEVKETISCSKVSENIGTKVSNKGNTSLCKMIPVAEKCIVQKPSNVAVPRKCPPLSAPLLNDRPLVLTTHLVPSLPIGLFEVLVEAIEVATEKPVVLLYEPRSDRPVPKEITDIAILPANENWEDGELLPVSFCFEHHLNKHNSPCVYVDIVVAADRASHVEDITDLRGHRCSLPDRKKKIGAAALLFNHLRTKGESPAFFGNTLDADTQVATLQMVAGKQAEIGILESPVIKCHKNTLPGIDSLHILTSLGPLPPYRIMTKKTLPDTLVKKITAYLLNIDKDKEWIDRFAPFSVKGFTKNFAEFYELGDVKSAATSVPYY